MRPHSATALSRAAARILVGMAAAAACALGPGSSPARAQPPGPVTSFIAEADNQVKLSWTVSTGAADSFVIGYSTTGPIVTEADFSTATLISTQPAALSPGTTQILIVTGLTNFKNYWWVIKASNSFGLSGVDLASPEPVVFAPDYPNLLSASVFDLPSPDHSGFLGFQATYYADAIFSTLASTRTDTSIAFNWCSDPLPPGTNTTDFSARWQARVWMDAGQTTFTITNVQSFGRVYIDGVQQLFANNAPATTVWTDTGSFRDLKVEYNKSGGSCGTGSGPRITESSDPQVKGTEEWVYQAATAGFVRLKLSVDYGATRINRISIQKTGTGPNGDVQFAQLWQDANASGLLETASDVLLASATLSGSPGTADFNLPVTTITAGAPLTYIIAYKMDVAAGHNNTVGMSLPSVSYIGFANPSGTIADSADFPLDSSVFTVRQTLDPLYHQTVDVTSGTIVQGYSSYPFLKTSVWTDNNGLELTGINVQRTGTGSDSDFTAVKIYLDNGDGVFGAGDSPISSGFNIFSGSVSSISFVTSQLIDASTKTFFVVADVSPFAGVGKTVGMQLASTAAFTVTYPDIVYNSGYPAGTALMTMQEYPDLVSLTTATSVAPTSVSQTQQDASMLRFAIGTSQSNADWTKLRVLQLGTVGDSGIDDIRIWKDLNGNGLLDTGIDQLVSTGTNRFVSGSCNVALTTQTLGPTAATYFVAVDISTNAAPYSTLRLSVASSNYFTIATPNTMSSALLPLLSSTATVSEPAGNILVTGNSLAPLSAYQSDTGVAMLKLRLTMDRYNGQWTALKVLRTGTASDSDIALVRLYADNGNGTYGPEDTQISQGTFSGGSVILSTFALSQMLDSASTATYFVTYDISPNSAVGVTVGARITNSSFLTPVAPDLVGSSGFPVDSSSTTLAATVDGFSLAGIDEGLSSVTQGSTATLFMTLTAAATAHGVSWDRVTVDKLGSLPDSDVRAVRLFQDTNGDGAFQYGTDQEVTSGSDLFSGGECTLIFPTAVSVSTSSRKFFLTLDLSPTASIGDDVGVRVFSSSSVLVQPPDFVVNSGFPADSSLASVADKADYVQLSSASITGSIVYQNEQDHAFLKLTLRTNEDQANWTALRVDKNGTLSDTAVTAVRLWKDLNGNGTLDTSSDTLVASTIFSGGVANFGFAPVTITTAPVAYFLTMNIDPSAPAGATIGARLGSSYFTIASPDQMTAFSAFDSGSARVVSPQTPATPVVTDEGDYTGKFDQLGFSWTSSVPSGSIDKAFYAIGTSSSTHNVRGWTEIPATETSVTAAGLTLQDGQTYFASVQVRSSFGVWSDTGTSDGITLDLKKPKVPEQPDSSIGDKSFVLNWSVTDIPPSGVEGYIVEERPGDKPNFSPLDASFLPAGIAFRSASYRGFQAPTVSSTTVVVTGKAPGTYFYRIVPVSGAGVSGDPSPVVRIDFGLSLLAPVSGINNYPNPFDSRKQSTTINYTLSQDASVNLRIYDAFGGLVKEMSFGSGSVGGAAGANQVTWDGTDSGGRKVSMGVYYAIVDVAGVSSSSSKTPLVIGVVH